MINTAFTGIHHSEGFVSMFDFIFFLDFKFNIFLLSDILSLLIFFLSVV